MLKRYQEMVGGLFRVADAIVIGLVWLLAQWLRTAFPVLPGSGIYIPYESYMAVLPLVILIWVATLSLMGAYRSRHMLRRTHEAQLILKAHAIAFLVFVALVFILWRDTFSRGVMLYFAVLGGFFLVAARLFLRNILRSLRKKGFQLRRVLVVGEGQLADALMWSMGRFPELGMDLVGRVVDDQSEPKEVEFHGQKIPLLGTFSELSQVIRTNDVQEVVLALPRKQYEQLDAILKSIHDETVELRLAPDIHEFMTLGCEIEYFNGYPIVNLNESPLEGWGSVLKRFTDLGLALIASTLAFIPMVLIAVMIKLTSRGPIFYRQERMGLDGRTFNMIKFRSMKLGAEQETGAVWAKEDDPRKTRLGSFLRATSLDELPQLWNVLKGEMSLVGPRPERPVFVDQFRKDIPHYMLRHKVKAGMTGWAQVNGWRGNTSLQRRIEFDLYYIQNWSYFLDLKILIMTVWRGLINKNAY